VTGKDRIGKKERGEEKWSSYLIIKVLMGLVRSCAVIDALASLYKQVIEFEFAERSILLKLQVYFFLFSQILFIEIVDK
jgi:hypothetical protein